MLRVLSLLAVMIVLAACETADIAQFWRPISAPNVGMTLDDAQVKLNYDLSQCNCGIFPVNVPHSVKPKLEVAQQRLNETAVTEDEFKGQCIRRPSLVVAECMRARGWETTNCSGRMPVAGGAAVCSTYAVPKE